MPTAGDLVEAALVVSLCSRTMVARASTMISASGLTFLMALSTAHPGILAISLISGFARNAAI